MKMKENKVNRLSSSEKENGILKATIEEIEKFMKLFEDCDKINNELVIKIVQLEAAVDSNGKDKQGKGNATVTNQSSFKELKVVLKKDLEEKEKALENAKFPLGKSRTSIFQRQGINGLRALGTKKNRK